MDGIADYVFLRQLGEGNNGWFYLAERPPRLPVDDDLVVVKVLGGTSNSDQFQRAVRELRAFAAVRSPHLAQLYDAGQDGGTVYYAMKHHPLGSLATPAVALPRAQRLAAVRDAARAAHALHEAGIVHRDIQPANILLEENGARLSDLGLAHHLNPGITVSALGSLRSLEFVDPGVLRGARVSRASDIWSLGVTLHVALAGRGIYPSLPAGDALLALRQVISQARRPVELAADLDDDERAVVGRALEPDPAARFQTAAELAEAVGELARAASPA